MTLLTIGIRTGIGQQWTKSPQTAMRQALCPTKSHHSDAGHIGHITRQKGQNAQKGHRYIAPAPHKESPLFAPCNAWIQGVIKVGRPIRSGRGSPRGRPGRATVGAEWGPKSVTARVECRCRPIPSVHVQHGRPRRGPGAHPTSPTRDLRHDGSVRCVWEPQEGIAAPAAAAPPSTGRHTSTETSWNAASTGSNSSGPSPHGSTSSPPATRRDCS